MITDVNGEHSFDVMNGKDGKDGECTVTEAKVLELITKQLGDVENGTY